MTSAFLCDWHTHPTPSANENEYFRFAYGRRFGELGAPLDLGLYRSREEGRTRYSYAIPNEAALRVLCGLSPLVEIGAGCGYWAHLLRERGADIVAYDITPPIRDDHANLWCRSRRDSAQPIVGRAWTQILRGGPHVLKGGRHADRTLFLCWPPYNTPLAYIALRRYAGDTVAYVGESDGCTADDRFRALLEAEWDEPVRLAIPQWCGIHDALYIYRRKTPPPPAR